MRQTKRRSPALPIAIVILLLVIAAVSFIYMKKEQQYEADLLAFYNRADTTLVEITVPENSNVKTIASILEEHDVIPNANSFVRYTKESGESGTLQAGTFYIRKNLSIAEVVAVLNGQIRGEEVRLTIPEGYTVIEIADLLVTKGLLDTKEEFLDCIVSSCDFTDFDFLPAKNTSDLAFPYSYIEGYLFPDTYFVQKDGFSPSQFIRTQLKTFQLKALPLLPKSADKIEETVILASILEKESRPRDNQPLVAGILWNRISNNIQLATDATNRYIMEDPLQPITAKSLSSSNPYNLRRQKGLPPSAIGNPGLATIRAILNPEDSDYFYYLHDSKGQIYFGKTEAEHNRNKRMYIN